MFVWIEQKTCQGARSQVFPFVEYILWVRPEGLRISSEQDQGQSPLGLFLLMRETDIRLLTHRYFIKIVRSVLNEEGFCAWVNPATHSSQFPRGGLRFLSSAWGQQPTVCLFWGYPSLTGAKGLLSAMNRCCGAKNRVSYKGCSVCDSRRLSINNSWINECQFQEGLKSQRLRPWRVYSLLRKEKNLSTVIPRLLEGWGMWGLGRQDWGVGHLFIGCCWHCVRWYMDEWDRRRVPVPSGRAHSLVRAKAAMK